MPGERQDAPSLGAKLAFLSSPEGYNGAAAVEARETNMAWVFLAGDRVYKLKKPVRNRLLDFSTPEARRHFCEEEVRLNRRLAPDVYLGVARLTLEADGELALDGDGAPVDWLVKMRRLPEALMLDHAIRAGEAPRDRLDAVAARLAAFYRGLPPETVDPAAHIRLFERELDENREVFGERAYGPAAARGMAMTGRLADFLRHASEVVGARVAAGRIVEGHGDLRPEHICLCDPPVVIDCLEFSRELRQIDPVDELSFLAMECGALGAPEIGRRLFDRCLGLLGDRPPDRLVAFHTTYRATLRARQALAHLLAPQPRSPARWVPLARRYLDRAEAAAVSMARPADRPASRPS